MNRSVIVLTTLGTGFNARALATDLVERRLVACVNIVGPITSIYRWEGRVHEEGEQLLIMKTTEERVPELRDALFAQHPYEVPEFVVVTIDRIEGPYAGWLRDSTA
ncbi:MAG TPA: divalent-cation tolerance protein CutA [Thermoanaerobaculia bacterium]|nr:divalent-cation tolerance protein CutA [Thermoanaerobaculia bacterium]